MEQQLLSHKDTVTLENKWFSSMNDIRKSLLYLILRNINNVRWNPPQQQKETYATNKRKGWDYVVKGNNDQSTKYS